MKFAFWGIGPVPGSSVADVITAPLVGRPIADAGITWLAIAAHSIFGRTVGVAAVAAFGCALNVNALPSVRADKPAAARALRVADIREWGIDTP